MPAEVDPITAQMQHEEANAFAMSLLMPGPLVRAAWGHDAVAHLHYCDRITTLATKFDVEVPIMTIRLVQLGIIRTGRF